MRRKTTMRRVRKGKSRPAESGFIVTWDVNSADRSSANRLHRRLFGDVTYSGGKVYRYPGLLEKEGVRYMGQSVVFVRPALLGELDSLLTGLGIDHEATRATLG